MEETEKKSTKKKVLSILGKVGIVVLETLLLLIFALYGVMAVLAKGPSPTARDLFVLSVRETSAAGFLANLFFTEEEIAAIGKVEEEVYDDTDTSLIVIPPTQPEGETPKADAWGLIDEDGDGLIVENIKGDGYNGYMLVVLDPSRVIMASKPEDFGVRGYTVEEMVKEYDAIAGINAGGFYDPNGKGNGSIPETMVVYDGVIYHAEKGIRTGFVGFDDNYIMHVGKFTAAQIREKNIQYGVAFGPVLISNGEPVKNSYSGVNPRTAIGQRSDGAILMLVIEGRMISSLGVTYEELTNIMLSYGAVNACNLDGGSSSVMWYEDGYINKSASLLGYRPIPTCFLVLKEGVYTND